MFFLVLVCERHCKFHETVICLSWFGKCSLEKMHNPRASAVVRCWSVLRNASYRFCCYLLNCPDSVLLGSVSPACFSVPMQLRVRNAWQNVFPSRSLWSRFGPEKKGPVRYSVVFCSSKKFRHKINCNFENVSSLDFIWKKLEKS